jgi:drug/metabolite transporter (DMT)-like permease
MGSRNLVELFVLAALWGASFLCMRVAAPVLGPVPLMALRVGIAAAALLPVLAFRGGLGALRDRPGHVLVVGAINSALPFCLLAYATLSVSAGLASILNATSPLWGGMVAHLWLGDRLGPSRIAGLVVGFSGVALLFWGRASFTAGGAGLAVVAALAATLSYGIAASYTKRHLAGMNALALSAGSQLAATLLLAPAAAATWPAGPVSAAVWVAVAVLGIACTAAAYVIYFRLIASVGPARAIAVTFLIPAFAMLWGGLFLGERLSARMIACAAVVLAGTALATGTVRLPARGRAASSRGVASSSPTGLDGGNT